MTIPIKMDGAILRDEESPIELMERAKHIYEN